MITAFFVCQSGPLELKSRILVASLRKYSQAPITVRACVPAGMGTLCENTLDFFKKYDVEIVPFEPVTARAYNYLIGNKIDAACGQFEPGRAIFMDTDIFAQFEFDLNETCKKSIFAAPVSSQTVLGVKKSGKFNEFLKAYNPSVKVPMAKAASGADIVAGFNSGFVSFATGTDFPQAWRRMVDDIMKSDILGEVEKKPYADQLALVFMHALDSSGFATGDFRWNASINRDASDAFFCHYHQLCNLFLYDHALDVLHELDEDAKSRGARMLSEISFKDFMVGPRKTRHLREGRLVTE